MFSPHEARKHVHRCVCVVRFKLAFLLFTHLPPARPVIGGALTGFVPQIVPGKVPNIFHFIEVFKPFFEMLLLLCVFFVKSREGVDPP